MAFSCKSQVTSIAPLNGLSFEHPNGTYFKDLNNELDYYTGRWEGISNNKKYIFEYVKFTQHLNNWAVDGSYNYSDKLQGKFKVIDLVTNQVLYDDLNVVNYDDYLISGIVKKNKSFSFMYLDKPEKCNLQAEFYLMRRDDLPSNQLKYCCFTLKNYGDLMGCSTYSDIHQIPIFLPKEDLILTKQ